MLQTRQKQWATKTKTGCLTCRARRVKCGEEKPRCKRCDMVGKACEYPPLVRETGVILRRLQSATASHSISAGVRPADWDFADAAKYLFEVIVPRVLVPGQKQPQFDIFERFGDKNDLLLAVVHDRLLSIANAQAIVPVVDKQPYAPHLWLQYHKRMLRAVQSLNELIASRGTPPKILFKISDILTSEIHFSYPTWRSHIEAIAACARLCGGLDHILAAPGTPCSTVLRLGYRLSTLCNATSPVHEQILAYNSWTISDIEKVCLSEGIIHSTCPTELLILIGRITALRRLCYQEIAAIENLREAATTIFHNIYAFNADSWTDLSSAVDPKVYILHAQKWKSAVQLYGLCSLPVDVCIPAETLQVAKKALCQGLKQLLDEEMQLKERLRTCTWPLAILGVAAVDQGEELRDQVKTMFELHYGHVDTCLIMRRAFVKIAAFWESGSTQWDQCFDEPCMIE